jgi:hypothetical protein
MAMQKVTDADRTVAEAQQQLEAIAMEVQESFRLQQPAAADSTVGSVESRLQQSQAGASVWRSLDRTGVRIGHLQMEPSYATSRDVSSLRVSMGDE